MTRRLPLLLLLAGGLTLAGWTVGSGGMAATMGWGDLYGRPKVSPDTTIAYGADPLQHVDVWLPAGAGPHPVVVMVHGGCWQTDVATADIMNWAADDLRKRGIAVWNIEYRGIDRPGGGYPGTFQDVAAATDALATHAARWKLDMSKAVAIGHSAGGHLVLWLAARSGLPEASPLRSPHPLPLRAIVSLGGLPDLEAARTEAAGACGADTVDRLVGDRADRFADTSPARLRQPTLPITLINGAVDGVAPPATAAAYAKRAPQIQTIVVPGEGHVEEIAPGTRSWAEAVAAIQAAFTIRH